MKKQTFKVCGITTISGISKVRWTDDITRRVKLFDKQGATRCDLVDLPSDMNKLDALYHIQKLDDFSSSNDQILIQEAIEYRMKVKQQQEGTYIKKSRGRPRKNGPKIVKMKVNETDILRAVNMVS